MFDKEGKQFNEESILNNSDAESSPHGKYYVLWYDAKMKNYQLLIEALAESKLVQTEIQPVLIVDQ